MTETKRAEVREENGDQVIVLPDEFRIDGDEVIVSRDESTGRLSFSADPEPSPFRTYLEFRDSLDVPQELLDEYMSERPRNRPLSSNEEVE